jgi:regulatory protein
MAENNLFKSALSKAMNQCSGREYCCYDIREKLIVWGIAKNDSEKIISVLIKENFINETRYANAFVKDKFKYNKWGKVKIAAHLKSKQIPEHIVRSAIDSIDYGEYMNVLKNLIAIHKKSVKAKNQYDLKGKLLRYGLSKGFESSLLYEILNDTEE